MLNASGPGSQRARLAAPQTLSREVWLCAALCVLGALVSLWPQLEHLRRIPDRGDPLFSAWRIGHVAYALWHAPASLFDANIFYPRTLTFTYSDATLLQGMLGAPLVHLGFDPLIVSNALLVLSFPLTALAAYWAGLRITGHPGAAMLGGLLAAWFPFHGEHYSHLELNWFMFVPLSLVACAELVAAPGVRRGLSLGLLVGLQWWASMYFGLMLTTLLIPLAGGLAWWWRPADARALMAGAASAAVVAVTAMAVVAAPYVRSRADRGDRVEAEVWPGSAMPADYVHPHPRLANYQWISREGALPERQLLPGASTVMLAALALIPPFEAATVAVAAAGALSFDWSLGFNGATYPSLYRHFFPFRGMRVPARFAAFVGCALSLLAAIGVARAIRGLTPRTQWLIVGTAAVAAGFDLRMQVPLRDYYATIPGIYGAIDSRAVLAEFPADQHLDFMYFSTAHHAHLLGGYSGFLAYDPRAQAAWARFPEPDFVNPLRDIGATHVTYNCAIESRPWRCDRMLAALESNPDLELVRRETWEGAAVVLYRLK